MRTIELAEEVRRKALLRGAQGEAWLRDLPQMVAELESAWQIAVGPPLGGGTEAFVAEAVTASGEAAVLKLTIRGQDPDASEARTLEAGRGVGYARLIRSDASRDAILVERLGPCLHDLGLSVEAQIGVICRTLRSAWTAPVEGLDLIGGDEKARRLAAFIEEGWERLGRPCSARAVDVALSYAARRAAAHDRAAVVLAHGDAHAWNTLQVPGEPAHFRLVDPDGLVIEPAYDLAIPMREWGAELLAGDPVALGRRRCALLARLTGVEAEPIWEWGFVERVSTGLVLKQIGLEEVAAEFFQVADLWAEAA